MKSRFLFLVSMLLWMFSGPSVHAEGGRNVPGQYILYWNAPHPNPTDVMVLQDVGGRRISALPQHKVELWAVSPEATPRFLEAVKRLSGRVAVEPNRWLTLPERWGPSLPQILEEGAPHDPYYTSYAVRYLRPLGMEEAWAITQGDPRVVVAVIDTGVDCAHPDLRGACWQNEDEIAGNGVDDDRNGYVDDVGGWNFASDSPNVFDVHYHGTHVAGIIAARANNGIGIAGVVPKATIMPLVVFQPQGVGTYYDLLRAMFYAVDNGARVINLSLGATSYGLGEAMAVRYAEEHGVVVVAAAGNNSREVNFYPAAHPTVLAVSALTVSGEPARFSNWGEFVDVAAPGVSIMSTIPGGRYGVLSGTSMAAPHVSGLAALILSLNPQLSPSAVRSLIEQTAVDQIGPSSLDPPGKDPHYGYGRIHMARAVKQVSPAPFPPFTSSAPQLPWDPMCVDVVKNGGFEEGLAGWKGYGVRVVPSPVYAGDWALRFDQGAGEVRQRLLSLAHEMWEFQNQHRFSDFTARPLRFTFRMALRIETQDAGFGRSPDFPFDDWISVRLEHAPSQDVVTLVRAGNTSDRVNMGLEWDLFFGIFPGSLLGRRLPTDWSIVIQTGDDGDAFPTRFTVDDVQVCVVLGRPRGFVPWVVNGSVGH